MLPTSLFETYILVAMPPVLKLFNSLTDEIEIFHPCDKNDVTMYCCGPTVYDVPHLGHARTYIFVDCLRRILTHHFRYHLTTVMNVTDLDDKIIQLGGPRIARFFEAEFFKTMESLNVLRPHITARITEHLNVIQYFTHTGLRSHAYEKEGDLLFDSRRSPKGRVFPHLEKRDEQLDTQEKDPRDFVLWKSKAWTDKDGSEHSSMPGWHSSCAALAAHFLGRHVDLHVGGSDLKFPHHENAIALGRAYFDVDRWVEYCLHTGHLQIAGKKMSKSLKNFTTIDEVVSKGVSPLAVRWLFMKHPYAKPMQLSEEALAAAQKEYASFMSRLIDLKRQVKGWKRDGSDASQLQILMDVKEKVSAYLEDNLNIPGALQTLETFVQQLSSKEASQVLLRYGVEYVEWVMDQYFGLYTEREEKEEKLLQMITQFRSSVRTWTLKRKASREKEEEALLKMCDEVRQQLAQHGYVIEDS